MNKHSRQNHSAEQACTVIYSFICPTIFPVSNTERRGWRSGRLGLGLTREPAVQCWAYTQPDRGLGGRKAIFQTTPCDPRAGHTSTWILIIPRQKMVKEEHTPESPVGGQRARGAAGKAPSGPLPRHSRHPGGICFGTSVTLDQ